MYLDYIERLVVSVVVILAVVISTVRSYDSRYLDLNRVYNANTTGNIPPHEYDALYDLYNSTEGGNWYWFNGTGLDSGIPWAFSENANPCLDRWQGIQCNAQNDTSGYRHVSILQLSGHNLIGTIPESICNLTELTILYLNDNIINGTIPQDIGNALSHMLFFDLSYNYLTGPLPESIGNMTHMQDLNMYTNLLTGTLPRVWSQMRRINELDVNTNLLTGTVPSSYKQFEDILFFSLYLNHLSGNLDQFLGNFSRARQISIGDNLFTGTIPDLLGTYKHLTELELNGNIFTGSLAPQLFDLPELYQFAVSENLLTGTIPAELASARQLSQIFMFGCYFTGSIPSSIGTMNELTEISMDFNLLSSSIPLSIGVLQKLQYMYLQSNMFTGLLPTSLSNLSAIQEMFLQNNRLSGSLHRVFNATIQHQLTIIQVSNNQLTGSLPEEPFRLPVLNTFVSVSNCFTGTLPSVICNNTQLTSLILDGLHSATSCRLQILAPLFRSYYTNDRFHGTVPACMFSMNNLSTLHISGNGLTGSLPDTITLSHRLLDLTLSHNALTGTIPMEFQQRVWGQLDLSFNRLTGQLRSDFATKQFDIAMDLRNREKNYTVSTSVSSLSLQNNRISGLVPSSINQVANISILGSNMFSCFLDKRDLPKHDSDRTNYPCGSDSFNIPYYAWLIIISLVLVAGVVYLRRREVFERYERLKNGLESLRKWSLDKADMPRSFRYVSDMADILCQVGGACTLLIVVVLVPWYAAGSVYFGTYTHQYAWAVSAAFMSGYAPLSVELCVMLFLMLAVILSLTYLTAKYDIEVHYQPTRFEARAADGRLLYSSERKTTVFQRLAVYAAYALVNLAVVVGVNVAFVYIVLYRSNNLLILAQIALSLFKLCWNGVSTPFLIRLIADYLAHTTSGTGFVSIQVMVALFNNIAIPCLVVAVVSPSCFYNVFDQAPSVNSRFIYYSCSSFLTSGCNIHSPEIITTTFVPPFRYDFQCSSGILTYYAPAFAYLAIAATFFLPMMKVLIQQWHKHAEPNRCWFRLLDTVLPRIFKPLPAKYLADNREVSMIAMPRDTVVAPGELRRNVLKPYFDANIYIITLMTYLGILLTFGVVFPPLGVAMWVTMMSVAWQGKLAVGRFLCISRELNAHKFVDIVEQECKGAVTIPKIRRCIFMIMCFCSCFYGLFLFDTLGDAVGPKQAIWVLIMFSLLPLFIYLCHQVRTHCCDQRLLRLFWVETRLGSLHSIHPPRRTEEDEMSVEMRRSSGRALHASALSTGSRLSVGAGLAIGESKERRDGEGLESECSLNPMIPPTANISVVEQEQVEKEGKV